MDPGLCCRGSHRDIPLVAPLNDDNPEPVPERLFAELGERSLSWFDDLTESYLTRQREKGQVSAQLEDVSAVWSPCPRGGLFYVGDERCRPDVTPMTALLSSGSSSWPKVNRSSPLGNMDTDQTDVMWTSSMATPTQSNACYKSPADTQDSVHGSYSSVRSKVIHRKLFSPGEASWANDSLSEMLDVCADADVTVESERASVSSSVWCEGETSCCIAEGHVCDSEGSGSCKTGSKKLISDTIKNESKELIRDTVKNESQELICGTIRNDSKGSGYYHIDSKELKSELIKRESKDLISDAFRNDSKGFGNGVSNDILDNSNRAIGLCTDLKLGNLSSIEETATGNVTFGESEFVQPVDYEEDDEVHFVDSLSLSEVEEMEDRTNKVYMSGSTNEDLSGKSKMCVSAKPCSTGEVQSGIKCEQLVSSRASLSSSVTIAGNSEDMPVTMARTSQSNSINFVETAQNNPVANAKSGLNSSATMTSTAKNNPVTNDKSGLNSSATMTSTSHIEAVLSAIFPSQESPKKKGQSNILMNIDNIMLQQNEKAVDDVINNKSTNIISSTNKIDQMVPFDVVNEKERISSITIASCAESTNVIVKKGFFLESLEQTVPRRDENCDLSLLAANGNHSEVCKVAKLPEGKRSWKRHKMSEDSSVKRRCLQNEKVFADTLECLSSDECSLSQIMTVTEEMGSSVCSSNRRLQSDPDKHLNPRFAKPRSILKDLSKPKAMQKKKVIFSEDVLSFSFDKTSSSGLGYSDNMKLQKTLNADTVSSSHNYFTKSSIRSNKNNGEITPQLKDQISRVSNPYSGEHSKQLLEDRTSHCIGTTNSLSFAMNCYTKSEYCFYKQSLSESDKEQEVSHEIPCLDNVSEADILTNSQVEDSFLIYKHLDEADSRQLVGGGSQITDGSDNLVNHGLSPDRSKFHELSRRDFTGNSSDYDHHEASPTFSSQVLHVFQAGGQDDLIHGSQARGQDEQIHSSQTRGQDELLLNAWRSDSGDNKINDSNYVSEPVQPIKAVLHSLSDSDTHDSVNILSVGDSCCDVSGFSIDDEDDEAVCAAAVLIEISESITKKISGDSVQPDVKMLEDTQDTGLVRREEAENNEKSSTKLAGSALDPVLSPTASLQLPPSSVQTSALPSASSDLIRSPSSLVTTSLSASLHTQSWLTNTIAQCAMVAAPLPTSDSLSSLSQPCLTNTTAQCAMVAAPVSAPTAASKCVMAAQPQVQLSSRSQHTRKFIYPSACQIVRECSNLSKDASINVTGRTYSPAPTFTTGTGQAINTKASLIMEMSGDYEQRVRCQLTRSSTHSLDTETGPARKISNLLGFARFSDVYHSPVDSASVAVSVTAQQPSAQSDISTLDDRTSTKSQEACGDNILAPVLEAPQEAGEAISSNDSAPVTFTSEVSHVEDISNQVSDAVDEVQVNKVDQDASLLKLKLQTGNDAQAETTVHISAMLPDISCKTEDEDSFFTSQMWVQTEFSQVLTSRLGSEPRSEDEGDPCHYLGTPDNIDLGESLGTLENSWTSMFDAVTNNNLNKVVDVQVARCQKKSTDLKEPTKLSAFVNFKEPSSKFEISKGNLADDGDLENQLENIFQGRKHLQHRDKFKTPFLTNRSQNMQESSSYPPADKMNSLEVTESSHLAECLKVTNSKLVEFDLLLAEMESQSSIHDIEDSSVRCDVDNNVNVSQSVRHGVRCLDVNKNMDVLHGNNAGLSHRNSMNSELCTMVPDSGIDMGLSFQTASEQSQRLDMGCGFRAACGQSPGLDFELGFKTASGKCVSVLESSRNQAMKMIYDVMTETEDEATKGFTSRLSRNGQKSSLCEVNKVAQISDLASTLESNVEVCSKKFSNTEASTVNTEHVLGGATKYIESTSVCMSNVDEDDLVSKSCVHSESTGSVSSLAFPTMKNTKSHEQKYLVEKQHKGFRPFKAPRCLKRENTQTKTISTAQATIQELVKLDSVSEVTFPVKCEEVGAADVDDWGDDSSIRDVMLVEEHTFLGNKCKNNEDPINCCNSDQNLKSVVDGKFAHDASSGAHHVGLFPCEKSQESLTDLGLDHPLGQSSSNVQLYNQRSLRCHSLQEDSDQKFISEHVPGDFHLEPDLRHHDTNDHGEKFQGEKLVGTDTCKQSLNDRSCSSGVEFQDFLTAGGARVTVSDEALCQARNILSNTDTEGEFLELDSSSSSSLPPAESCSHTLQDAADCQDKSCVAMIPSTESCSHTSQNVSRCTADCRSKCCGAMQAMTTVNTAQTPHFTSHNITSESLKEDIKTSREALDLHRHSEATAGNNITVQFQNSGFSTASGHRVQVSDAALQHTKGFFDETEEDRTSTEITSGGGACAAKKILAGSAHTSKEITSKMISFGFTTASGSKVTVSESSLQHARNFFCGDEKVMDGCEMIQDDDEVTSLMLPRSVEDNQVVEDSDKLTDVTVRDMSEVVSSELASGKATRQSCEASDNSCADSPADCVSDNGRNPDKTFSDKTFSDKTCDEQRGACLHPAPLSVGFTSANGLAMIVSEAALQSARKLISEAENHAPTPHVPALNTTQTPHTTSNSITSESLKEDIKTFREVPYLHRYSEATADNRTVQFQNSGFSTASGHKVKISDAALQHTKGFFDETEGDRTSTEITSGGGACVPKKISPAGAHTIKEISKKISFGFTTASGCKVTVSESSLQHARDFFCDDESVKDGCEMIQDVLHLQRHSEAPAGNNRTIQFQNCGFSTASGHKVQVSDAALQHTRGFFDETEGAKTSKEIAGNHAADTCVLSSISRQLVSEAEDHATDNILALIPDTLPEQALEESYSPRKVSACAAVSPYPSSIKLEFSKSSVSESTVSEETRRQGKGLSEVHTFTENSVPIFTHQSSQVDSISQANSSGIDFVHQVNSCDSKSVTGRSSDVPRMNKRTCGLEHKREDSVPSMEDLMSGGPWDRETVLQLEAQRSGASRSGLRQTGTSSRQTDYKAPVKTSSEEFHCDRRNTQDRRLRSLTCGPVTPTPGLTAPPVSCVTSAAFKPPYKRSRLDASATTSGGASVMAKSFISPVATPSSSSASKPEHLHQASSDTKTPVFGQKKFDHTKSKHFSWEPDSPVYHLRKQDVKSPYPAVSGCRGQTSNEPASSSSNSHTSEPGTGLCYSVSASWHGEGLVTKSMADTPNRTGLCYSISTSRYGEGLMKTSTANTPDNDSTDHVPDHVTLEGSRLRQQALITSKQRQRVRPRSGRWFESRKVKGRLSSFQSVGLVPVTGLQKDELVKLGVSRSTLEVNSASAGHFRFDLRHFYPALTSGVLVGDGALLVPDSRGYTGAREFYSALLTLDGVDPGLVDEAWVENHYKWIVWKLAAYEVCFPHQFAGRCLNPETVMLQLKYRYDMEVDACRRSAIKKIVERDDAACKRLVLCVASVKKSRDDQFLVELTDGWYSLPAQLDTRLCQLISRKKLGPGDKIVTSGAELVGCPGGCSPLEVKEGTYLRLSGNSTRPAPWWARLGYCATPAALCVPLVSLSPCGGVAGCVDVVVCRRYPVMFMEKLVDGTCVFHTSEEEDRARQRHEEQNRARMEKLYASLQKELEDRDRTMSRGSVRSSSRNDISQLCTGQEIALALDKTANPEELQQSLSCGQMEQLMKYRQEEMDKRQQEISRRMQDLMDQPGHTRNVVPVQKFKVCGCCSHDVDSKTSCVMSVWRPGEDWLEVEEGKRYKLFHVSVSAHRGRLSKDKVALASNRQTRIQPCPISENLLDMIFEKREAWTVSELSCRQLFGDEFDFVGVVMQVVAPHRSSAPTIIFATDKNRDILSIRYWPNCQAACLKTGQCFVALNLVLSTSPQYHGLVTADCRSDTTVFSTTSGQSGRYSQVFAQMYTLSKSPGFLLHLQKQMSTFLRPASPFTGQDTHADTVAQQLGEDYNDDFPPDVVEKIFAPMSEETSGDENCPSERSGTSRDCRHTTQPADQQQGLAASEKHDLATNSSKQLPVSSDMTSDGGLLVQSSTGTGQVTGKKRCFYSRTRIGNVFVKSSTNTGSWTDEKIRLDDKTGFYGNCTVRTTSSGDNHHRSTELCISEGGRSAESCISEGGDTKNSENSFESEILHKKRCVLRAKMSTLQLYDRPPPLPKLPCGTSPASRQEFKSPLSKKS